MLRLPKRKKQQDTEALVRQAYVDARKIVNLHLFHHNIHGKDQASRVANALCAELYANEEKMLEELFGK